MNVRTKSHAPRRRAALLAALALVAGAAAWTGHAKAAEGEVEQAKPALPLKAGYRILHNAFQLKAYYYAYAHVPVVPGEFTRYRGDEKATGAELDSSVDAALRDARTHPNVVLELDAVALRDYDAGRQAFPMDNRLFIPGMRYYFDVSPYHYVFAGDQGLNPLPCTDPATVAEIGRQVRDYRQFDMRVYARVTGADRERHAVTLKVEAVQLFDAQGRRLLDRAAGATGE